MLTFFTQVIADDSDRQYISDIFVSYERFVYHELTKYVSDPWELEDLFQSVFVKLINNIPTLRSLDRPRLTRYIAVTAKNTAINHLHRVNRFEFVSYEDTLGNNTSGAYSIEDDVFAKVCVDSIKEAWNKLDAQSQYYLDAKYTLGKNSVEIASELGVPPVNVRMAISRARKKLKSLL